MMKEKVLMVASVASMIQQFNIENLKILQSLGYEVHVACNFERGSTCSQEKINELKVYLEEKNIKFFQIDFSRSIFNIQDNIKAYRQLKKIILNQKYLFVHCHSPIGGVITRLICKNIDTKVIYTAHGFHFFKGAPLKNWLLFYPIEKYLSKYTDILITINKEDYQRAKDNFKMKQLEYILGVGVDVQYYQNLKIDIEKKRKELGLSMEQKILLSVGEINDNKNHKIVIDTLYKLNDPTVIYMIAGIGNKLCDLKKIVKDYGIEKQVKFLGYRNDIAELYKVSDVFIFPSKREGLSVALMEAISSEIPCIVSNIRGNNDLIANEINGYLFEIGKNFSVTFLEKYIGKILNSPDIRNQFKLENTKKSKQFSKNVIDKKMLKIYSSF